MFEFLIDVTQRHKPAGRLLDVGCGPGLLLDVARQRGYAVSGCDVSGWATAYARETGLDVATGSLESIGYATAQFDVVVINHTLEHVPEPLDLLREARRILADDGILVIGVPNFASLMARLMRARWAGLLPDQHLWHFTPATLATLLQRAGFVIRALVIQTTPHRHPVWVKQLALRLISEVGNWTRRGEGLLVVATKAEHAA